jgi:hypothetical protein
MSKAIPAITVNQPPVDKKKLRKEKLRKWRNIGIGVGLFLALFLWYGFQPIKGTIHVGICRTFLELNLKYPPTFRFVQYDLFQSAHRLYYTFYGPFGENRSNMGECTFKQDPVTGVPLLESVNINRKPVEQATVDAFNKTIPIVLQFEPSNNLPRPWRGDLYDLKRD